MRRQRVLVVGSGGREHALAWKLRQSPEIERILVAPGNAGTAGIAENVPIAPDNVRGLADLVEDRDIDLTVVGPEISLALGLVDSLRARDRAVFGPDIAGFRLEGSKAFAKDMMTAIGVPTASYQVCSRVDDARSYLDTARYPLVIKADGLAAGKGVVLCENERDARATVEAFMADHLHGSAGERVIIEDALSGPEVSLLALVDGREIIPLPVAQDHKRLRNRDDGPNTGGMGAYAPVPFLDSNERAGLIDMVMRPVVALLARAGTPYRGVLYAGLMLTPDGPHVLEFNCRFGDPETQVLLPLLADDLFPWLMAVTRGDLNRLPPALRQTDKSAVGVVLATSGYPETPVVGDRIDGLGHVPEDVRVFHGGTAVDDLGCPVTARGRVLTVVGLGDTLEQARQRAYSTAIDFPGMQFRSDIACLMPAHRRRIGILASGDGSNLQALLDASETGRIEADVAIVISGSTRTGALRRARRHNVPGVALPIGQRSGRSLQAAQASRQLYDQRLLEHLLPFDLDLLVLAGWMHVLSPAFLHACPFPVINVHPALLDADGSGEIEFEGHVVPVLRGMHAVHDAIEMKLPVTGVTIHHVTDRVDVGPIVLRQMVPIEADDCEESLYRRIKRIEHRLLVEAVSIVLASVPTGVVHA